MKKSVLALVLTLLALPGRAPAWGAYGHEVIATIAQAHLQPRTIEAINQLRLADPVAEAKALSVDNDGRYGQKDQRKLVQFLGQQPLDLALIGSWMDAWRGRHPETGVYHFLDLPVSGQGTPEEMDKACGGACVVEDILVQVKTLRTSSNQLQRLEAVLVLVHLVGDISQPLHCADRGDKGGNEEELRFGGRRHNLHAFLDTLVFKGDHLSPGRLAKQLDSGDVPPYRDAQVAGWALESWHLAKEKIYPWYDALPDHDAEQGNIIGIRELAFERLRLAGLRLAAVLNAALSGQ